MLWNPWRKEYLSTLTQDKKELVQTTKILKINESNIPGLYWSLGKIIETFPEKDDVVRTVKVKTPNNHIIRPANKLHLLESSD